MVKLSKSMNYFAKVSKKRDDPEHHLQVAVVMWLKLTYPNTFFTISPAGLRLPVYVGAKIKAKGYRVGTCDLLIFEARKGYNGFFPEFKIKPNKPSSEQILFMQDAEDRGYKTAVYYTYEDAIRGIKEYLSIK